MSDIALCTQDDLESIGHIDTDSITTVDLDEEIIQISKEIMAKAELTSVPTSIYAVKCCVFGVKADLEDSGIIKDTSRKISAFRDSDFSVNYVDDSSEREIPKTSAGKYEYYLEELMDNPFDYEIVDEGVINEFVDPRYL